MSASPTLDEELVGMVKEVVSECVFEFQAQKTQVFEDKIASLEGKLKSLEGKLKSLEGAAAIKEPTSEFQSRLASLEVAAAATSKGLEELQAALRAKAPEAGSQKPATCYDIRQLEEKISTLASEVALAKRAKDHESRSHAMVQKFGDVEAAQALLREQVGAMEERVGAMGDQINYSRITSAVFALDAIGLKESDRKICLERVKSEEDRLKQGKCECGTMPGGQAGPLGAITPSQSSCGSGAAVPAPSLLAPGLKHESRFKSLWRRAPAV